MASAKYLSRFGRASFSEKAAEVSLAGRRNQPVRHFDGRMLRVAKYSTRFSVKTGEMAGNIRPSNHLGWRGNK